MGTSTAVIAAHWRARRWKYGTGVGMPVPFSPAGIPYSGDAGGGPIGLTVELYLGSLGWTDISAFVLYRDSSQLVSITRGRPNETSQIQPQTATFQVNNRDGRFSPRNPNGAWYGLIGRNTPVRISRMQNGIRRYRFCGEVISWPTTWDTSGNDVWVDVPCAGQLRRLQQGTQTLGSAMFRAYALGESSTLNPVAYWPCEDGSTATVLASGLQGAPAMTFNGSPNLASNSQFLCSLPIPVLNGSTWYGAVPAYTGGTSNTLRFLMAVPSSTTTANGAVIAQLHTLGTVKRADLRWDSGGALQLVGFDASGSTLFDTGAVIFSVDGALLRVSVELNTNGSSVDYSIGTLAVGGSSALVQGGTLSSASVGISTLVVINPSAAITDIAIGHISVQSTSSSLFDLGSQLEAWNTEGAGNRYGRVMQEQGVNVGNFFPPNSLGGSAVAMGYQLSDTLANLIQQIADSDGDLIFEGTDQASVVRRSRISLYNQRTSYNNSRPGLTLDYAQQQLGAPLNPLDDDAYTRNDITAQRISGSFTQQTLTTGPLSTQMPPNGVGDYATTYSLSLGSDGQLPDAAGWRLHLGTVDEPRYPQISLNLRNTRFLNNVGLLNAALTLEIGDVVEIDNPPAQLPPDAIRQIVQGYSETMGVYEHAMVLNCSPEAPYRVCMLDDPVLAHLDTDGSTLVNALSPVLNANPFQSAGSSAGWSAFNGSMSVAGTSGSSNPLPAGGPTGYGLLLTANGGSNPNLFEGASQAAAFPVTPGQTYYVSALVYYPSAAVQPFVTVNFYDASFTFIPTSNTPFTVAANTWTALPSSFAAPAGAAYAAPSVGLSGAAPNGDTLYVANAVCWQGAVSVATTNSSSPLWTTSAGDFPFDIGVSPLGSGGERMTVTAVSGGASPQAFTVARAVNTIAIAQNAGADVRLWQPAVLSL